MSELKKCPFCGGEAEFYRTPIKTNGGWCDSIVVRCKECEARTNRVLYDNQKYKNDSEYDEAAVAWNTRKPVERVLEQLEEFLFHIGVNCALCHEKGGCESHRFCDDETLEEWLQSPVEV